MTGKTSRLALKAGMLWLAILVLAFLNGTLRELVLIPHWGRTPGLLISGILLSAAILIAAWIGECWYGPTTRPQQWRIGASWLVLTLAFEWTFGLLQEKSVGILLEAYTFKDGNLWPLVLLVVLIAPCAVGRGAR